MRNQPQIRSLRADSRCCVDDGREVQVELSSQSQRVRLEWSRSEALKPVTTYVDFTYHREAGFHSGSEVTRIATIYYAKRS